jgi:hypothetical protein
MLLNPLEQDHNEDWMEGTGWKELDGRNWMEERKNAESMKMPVNHTARMFFLHTKATLHLVRQQ